MIKLAELSMKILSQMKRRSDAGDAQVSIQIHNPGSIGGTPTADIKEAYLGIDWDHGKYMIVPEEPLIPFGSTREVQLLGKAVDAWEALPGDRNYTKAEIQKWMLDDLYPAIKEIRMYLGRKPKNG